MVLLESVVVHSNISKQEKKHGKDKSRTGKTANNNHLRECRSTLAVAVDFLDEEETFNLFKIH